MDGPRWIIERSLVSFFRSSSGWVCNSMASLADGLRIHQNPSLRHRSEEGRRRKKYEEKKKIDRWNDITLPAELLESQLLKWRTTTYPVQLQLIHSPGLITVDDLMKNEVHPLWAKDRISLSSKHVALGYGYHPSPSLAPSSWLAPKERCSAERPTNWRFYSCISIKSFLSCCGFSRPPPSYAIPRDSFGIHRRAWASSFPSSSSFPSFFLLAKRALRDDVSSIDPRATEQLLLFLLTECTKL